MLSPSFRIRSFARRNGRKTKAQTVCYSTLMPLYGIFLKEELISFQNIFHREAPSFLEIGFGYGQSLLALARLNPDKNFIGIETYRPGIGALLSGIHHWKLNNLRIIEGDAVDIIEKNIPNMSLNSVQIFFPDPWPKRRHQARRLIQPNFVKKIVQTLMQNGTLHLATDWEDYAFYMMKVLSQEEQLMNSYKNQQFALRSPYRPLFTKFEIKAQQASRIIYDLQFARK